MSLEWKAESNLIRKYAVGDPLSPYVSYYWIITKNFQAPTMFDIYPDGGMGLIFNLGEPISLNTIEYGKGLFFDGANSRCVQASLSGNTNILGIRFKPGGFNRFFSTDLSKFHNTFNKLDSTGYRFPEYCFEVINRCMTDRERITAIETWLASKYSEPDDKTSLVQSVLNDIMANQSNIELESFVNDVGVDIRKLQRLFKKQLGMSLGKLKGLIRATHARQLMTDYEQLSFLDITYKCGYYDQAHFNREFKGIFGITPTVYRKKEIQVKKYNK